MTFLHRLTIRLCEQSYLLSNLLFAQLAAMNQKDTKLEVPGLLMRLVQCNTTPKEAMKTPCPHIEKVWTAVADDGETPSRLALYFLSDVRPLLSSSNLYDEDIAQQDADASVAWVICSFINGREKDSPLTTMSASDSLSHTPAEGSRLVVNGSTPRPDKENDYHAWYDEEHGPMLSRVPGWSGNIRYHKEKSYGHVDTASFYGFNFYDAENGLGGPEWKASTGTEWTQRVRGNHAKPNIRRVWRIQDS